MKERKQFNLENLPIFLGLLGFTILFIMFTFTFCTIEEQDYSAYALFFMIDEYSLFPNGGLVFFIIFMINVLLYLSLLTIRLLRKNTVKIPALGFAGILINTLNVIFFLAFICPLADSSIFVLACIELIGLYGVYGAWIDICKGSIGNSIGKSKKYMVYSFFELICFLLPLCILICFILLAINGKNNNKSNTITINDRKYLKGLLVAIDYSI